MRTALFVLGLALVSCIGENKASAGEVEGNVPESVLRELGLGGMERVTDIQGSQVRGKFLFSQAYINYVVQKSGGPYFPTGGAIQNAMNKANQTVQKAFPNGIPYTNYGPYNPIIK